MRTVSSEYMRSVQLHRTQGIRNQMFVEVFMGLLNEEAKPDSTLQISQGLPFSNTQNMYDETKQTFATYASWENGGFSFSSTVKLLPKNKTYVAQGYTSKAISGSNGLFSAPPLISIAFTSYHSIVGLSLLFDKLLPASDFIVRAYRDNALIKSITVENNTEYDLRQHLGFEDFNKLTIEFTKGVSHRRIHLNDFIFGIGYIYGKSELIDFKHKRSAHPLSLELPQADFSFTAYNEDGRFEIDSDNSIVRFLEQEQQITLRYGYDVTGKGNFEWFVGGLFYLESWDVQGAKATFSSKDIFNKFTQSTYKKSLLDMKYHSMSKLAAGVLQDLGISNYYVDGYYSRIVSTVCPLPYTSHGECLQLIANHCSSTIEQAETGQIVLRQRQQVPVENWYASPRPDIQPPVPMLPFSNTSNILSLSPLIEYATWEENFFAFNSNLKLLPKNKNYMPQGHITNLFPNKNGSYLWTSSNYLVGAMVDFTRSMTFGELKIEFSNQLLATEVLVYAYRSGAVLQWSASFPVVNGKTVINKLFDNIIWVAVYLRKNSHKQRLRIKRFSINEKTGLEITPDDIIGNPKETLLPACKDIHVSYNSFWHWPGGKSVEFMRTNIFPNTLTEIKHGEPYYNLRIESENLSVVFETVEHYAHCTFVKISGVSTETEVVLYGLTYAKTAKNEVTVNINPTGQDAIIDNPIAQQQRFSADMTNWAAEYYKHRNQYDIDVLGYPECDAADIITYNGKSVVVLENELSGTSGAVRGKMKLRGN